MIKLLWLDTETTGLNVERCDIVQIAGIVIIDGKEQERFNLYCQPTNYESIEQEALNKNNLTIEKLKTFPLPQETYNKFKAILDKYIDRYNKDDKFYIAGHNVQFDLEFIQSFFEKMGDKFCMSYFKHFTVDLMHLITLLQASGCINLNSFKLGNIADYLTLEPNGDLHDAEADIDLTRRCYCKLAAKYIKFEDYK